MNTENTHLRLVNRLYTVVTGSITPIECWGFYLLSDEFKKEKELINKAGTIWLCSIYDTTELGNRELDNIINDATKSNHPDIVENCEQMKVFIKTACSFLEKFSYEEQLYLQDSRNQWVHGYQKNIHNNVVSIKYVKDGTLFKEKIPRETYISKIWDFHKNGETPDEILSPIIERALDQKHPYWNALKLFQITSEKIYEVLLKRERISFSNSAL